MTARDRRPDPEGDEWAAELKAARTDIHHEWGTIPVTRTRGRAPWEEDVPGEDHPPLAAGDDSPGPAGLPRPGGSPAASPAGPGPGDEPIETEEDAKRWVARRLEEAWAKSYIVRLWWQQREAL